MFRFVAKHMQCVEYFLSTINDFDYWCRIVLNKRQITSKTKNNHVDVKNVDTGIK